jgi:hypothetical protein
MPGRILLASLLIIAAAILVGCEADRTFTTEHQELDRTKAASRVDGEVHRPRPSFSIYRVRKRKSFPTKSGSATIAGLFPPFPATPRFSCK